jgi:hypothetical protein
MPGSSSWTSLSLSVTHNTGHDKIRLVHDSSKGDRKSITKLATFMNGPGGLCVDVTREPSGCAELGDQVVEALLVHGVLRVEFFQAAFQPERGKDGRSSMTGTNDVDEIQVVLARKIVEVGVY